MLDVLTYCNDTNGLQVKLASLAGQYSEIVQDVDENLQPVGDYWINWSATEVKKAGNRSLALIRVENLDLVNAVGFEVLASAPMGEDVYALLEGEALNKYNSAYPRTPETYYNEDLGRDITHTPPFEIGYIA